MMRDKLQTHWPFWQNVWSFEVTCNGPHAAASGRGSNPLHDIGLLGWPVNQTQLASIAGFCYKRNLAFKGRSPQQQRLQDSLQAASLLGNVVVLEISLGMDWSQQGLRQPY